MLHIHIICVGKLKEKFYREAVAEYSKRLSGYCKLQLTELPEERLPQEPSQAQIATALAREAASIRAKLSPNSRVMALCVEGKSYSSPELAQLVGQQMQAGAKELVLLVGGSYGLDEGLKREAWARVSMSAMTFPHHLARVMLLEQLYRSFRILEGSAYHK